MRAQTHTSVQGHSKGWERPAGSQPDPDTGWRPLGKEPLHFTAEASELFHLFHVSTIKCVLLNFRYKKTNCNDQSSLKTNDLIKKPKEYKILFINKK